MEVSEDILKTNLAMRVAIQTMKERCQSLQQRVTGLEEENFELRNQVRDQKNIEYSSSSSNNMEEIESLRKQIIDLQQQKAQMNDHVAMVATENRQLWTRLSQLSKRNYMQNLTNESEKPTGQNLIRSKTFTQHSPNPYLRPKLVESSEQFNKSDSISLEQVILFHPTIEKPNQVNSLKAEVFDLSNLDEVNKDIDVRELTSAASKCVEELNFLKQQLIYQQNELKNTISELKQKLANRVCKECELRSIKPETADKSLETDESLYTDISPSQSHQSQEESRDFHPDILNAKNEVQENIKVCPMCGRIFSQEVSFDNFREHVTEHFVDADEDTNIFDRQFEVISHKVGEF